MSKDIKKALEHCAEWKCDNCPNGDDLGSGEIVCRGRLLPQVLEYVSDLEAKLTLYDEVIKEREDDLETLFLIRADLEAKLAESEKKFKASKDAIKFQSEEQKEWMDKYFNTAIKLEKLEQQLAEKEKEIEDLKIDLEAKDFNINSLMEQRKRKQKFYSQDKILFAVEQLEKVKEWCENHEFSDEDDYVITYEPDEEDASGCVDYLKDFIDNQIEELKKGVK